MVEQITHVVEYDYWYRCSYGMELGANERFFTNEAAANDYSDFLKKNEDVVSVRVAKLDDPITNKTQVALANVMNDQIEVK
jgi:hypothetical protein